MCIANKRSRGLIVDVFYIADTDQLFASGQVVTATYPDPVKSPTWYVSNYYTSNYMITHEQLIQISTHNGSLCTVSNTAA